MTESCLPRDGLSVWCVLQLQVDQNVMGILTILARGGPQAPIGPVTVTRSILAEPASISPVQEAPCP